MCIRTPILECNDPRPAYCLTIANRVTHGFPKNQRLPGLTSLGQAASVQHQGSNMFKKWILVLGALVVTAAFAGVEVNTASEADLDSIKGIGPATSAKMLESRRNSKFRDWNDLIQRTNGIGNKRAAKLSTEGLRVNGLPYQAGTGSDNGPASVLKQRQAPQRNLPIAIAPRH